MIRKATKYDKKAIIELMLLFKKESGIKHLQDIDNEEYWNRLLDSILVGAGIIYLEEGKGLIMGVIIPSIWCNRTYVLSELAWYVKPEYRKTTVGYKLLKQFIEYGNNLKQEGRIKAFTVAKMITSPDIKYDRFGFNKLEETWIQ